MIDFVGLRRYFALISFALLVPCLVALSIWQLDPGIDFEGGIELEARFLNDVTEEDVAGAVRGAGFDDVAVEATEDATFVVRVGQPDEEGAAPPLDDVEAALEASVGEIQTVDSDVGEDGVELEVWFPADASQDDVRDALRGIGLGDARIQATGESTFKLRAQVPDDGDPEALRPEIAAALRTEVGPIFVLQSATVSGILSSEIAQDAGIALSIAAVAILIYISLAFRRLPNPLLYGSAAIVALLHDITIVVGVFSILGQVAEVEVNAMFVTGLLAIIGYSVNDTIVVFDRIRENQLQDPGARLRPTVNAAITQSLGRSLNTSITLILALVALMLIGGVTVRPLVLVLLVGAIAGTYSSIAVAAQIVVLWEEGSIQRRFGRRRQPARVAP